LTGRVVTHFAVITTVNTCNKPEKCKINRSERRINKEIKRKRTDLWKTGTVEAACFSAIESQHLEQQ